MFSRSLYAGTTTDRLTIRNPFRLFVEPVDEGLQSITNIDAGIVSQHGSGLRNVCTGAAYIAGLKRKPLDSNALATNALQLGNQLEQRHAGFVAEIEHFKRKRFSQCGDQAAHDVVNEGVVSSQVAIAEHRNRLALPDARHELVYRHVGSHPRTVNAEETENGDWNSVPIVKTAAECLGGLLARGVRRCGFTWWVFLAKGDAGGFTINR